MDSTQMGAGQPLVPAPSVVDGPCAFYQATATGRLRARVHFLREVLKSRGLLGTLRKVGEKLHLARPEARPAPRPLAEGEVLGLQPGEWVTVKSAEEIRATLDENGMHRRLGYMPEMWKYCGQTFPVYKRMTNLMVDATGELRHIKNTVLLEGTYCDGEFHKDCDASCHHLWREIWLRRTDPPPPDA